MNDINYVENGEKFVYKNSFMNNVYKEVSKEEYERLVSLHDSMQLEKVIVATLSDADRYGYGYYGYDLLQKNNKYYLGIKTGTSCK